MRKFRHCCQLFVGDLGPEVCGGQQLRVWVLPISSRKFITLRYAGGHPFFLLSPLPLPCCQFPLLLQHWERGLALPESNVPVKRYPDLSDYREQAKPTEGLLLWLLFKKGERQHFGGFLVHPRHSPGHFNMFSHLIFLTAPLGVGVVIPSCRPGRESLRQRDEGSTARKSPSRDSPRSGWLSGPRSSCPLGSQGNAHIWLSTVSPAVLSLYKLDCAPLGRRGVEGDLAY